MVTVFQARVTDQERAETTVTTDKGTAEWISLLFGSEIILDTAEEVADSDIDSTGRYRPRPIALAREISSHKIGTR